MVDHPLRTECTFQIKQTLTRLFVVSLLGACTSTPSVVDSSHTTDQVTIDSDSGSEPDLGTDTMLDTGPDVPEVWEPPVSCRDAGTSVADVTTSDAANNDSGVSVSGHAFAFTISGGRVEGAYVTMIEHPERCVRTGIDGFFRFDGVLPGSDLTLRMHHPNYPLIQTGTHMVPPTGIERLTFQAPDYPIYSLLARVTRTQPRTDRCQIAATVTEIGRSLYTTDWPSHGEAGATVTLSPNVAMVDGPIYFQYYGPGQILPDRTLRETTRDGGVLFLNVPPGDYVLSGHKTGVNFRDVRVHCEAGLLVNPSPPWSIQAY